MPENTSITQFLPDFWLNDDPEGHAKQLAEFLEIALNEVINNANLPLDIIETPLPALLKQFGCWEEATLIEKGYACHDFEHWDQETKKEILQFLVLAKPSRRTEAGLTQLITVLFGTDFEQLKINIHAGILELTLHFHDRETFERWRIKQNGQQSRHFEDFIENQVPLSIRKIRFLYRYYSDEIIIGRDYVGAEISCNNSP
jgi:hypothetical protein